MKNDLDLSLYLVASRGKKSDELFLNTLEEAIKGGVSIIQLREKELSSREFYKLGLKVQKLCKEYEIPFLINDRIDIALALDADGVHLGQEDLEVRFARKILGKEKIIGLSLKNLEQLKDIDGADYLGCGAIKATPTKESSVISFETLSQICEKVGANINDVRVGIGSDSRIGYSFIYPGCGYGGSCFPKDIQALSFIAKQNNVETKILDAIEYVNEYQKNLIANKIIKRFGENLDNKIFCIWGLSFKPETDDIREAPSIYLMQKLLQSNAMIQCYDPQANINMKAIFPNVKYYNNKYDAIDNADALIIMTEWKEFRNPDFKIIKDKLKNLIIFDGRNIYKDMDLNEFEYYYIGGGNHII